MNEQGVTTSTNPGTTVLDLSASHLGLLLPNMTTQQMQAIATPAASLLIYNTTVSCYEIYSGAKWQPWACLCSGAPTTPAAPTGANSACISTSSSYSVTAVNATLYTWTLSGGGTFSGSGTTTQTSPDTSVTVNWGAAGGTYSITVAAANSCGISAVSSAFVITITTGAPPAPAPTNSTGCSGNQIVSATATYSVAAVAGATNYTWTLSGGGVFSNATTTISGAAATSEAITWNATPGVYTMSVTVTNNCGTGPAGTLAVTTVAHNAGGLVFSYTTPGDDQTWTVPCGITTLTVNVSGAQGGTGTENGGFTYVGGMGGNVVGTLTVSGGQVLNIFVGQKGVDATVANAGYGTGGVGGNSDANGGDGWWYHVGGSKVNGAGGGGATDIRIGGTALADRVVVAGAGGGGGANNATNNAEQGGPGGAASAAAGGGYYNSVQNGLGHPGTGANGNNGTTGGVGGSFAGYCTPANGTIGAGSSACTASNNGGGGGGGGYYGGGAGCWAGGGGGNNYTTGLTTVTSTTAGSQAGNGAVTIAW